MQLLKIYNFVKKISFIIVVYYNCNKWKKTVKFIYGKIVNITRMIRAKVLIKVLIDRKNGINV